MCTEGFLDVHISDWIKFVMYPRNLPHGRKEDWNKFIVFIAVVIDSIWCVRNMIVHQNLTLDIP